MHTKVFCEKKDSNGLVAIFNIVYNVFEDVATSRHEIASPPQKQKIANDN